MEQLAVCGQGLPEIISSLTPKSGKRGGKVLNADTPKEPNLGGEARPHFAISLDVTAGSTITSGLQHFCATLLGVHSSPTRLASMRDSNAKGETSQHTSVTAPGNDTQVLVLSSSHNLQA